MSDSGSTAVDRGRAPRAGARRRGRRAPARGRPGGATRRRSPRRPTPGGRPAGGDRRRLADDMAYTSGTTGRPKGVAIGEGDFRRRPSGVVASADARGASAPTTCTCSSGPRTTRARSYWAQMHLALGATVVVMPKWDARSALAARSSATGDEHAHGAGELQPHPQRCPEDVRTATTCRRLKMVLHAAAPCPVPLKRAFMDFVGADKVWEYYGASEGGGTVDLAPGVARAPGQRRQAVPGQRVPDPRRRRQRCRPGEVGTIYVQPGRRRASSTTTTRRRPRARTASGCVHRRRRRLPRRGRLPLPHRPQERHGDLAAA